MRQIEIIGRREDLALLLIDAVHALWTEEGSEVSKDIPGSPFQNEDLTLSFKVSNGDLTWR